jgi:hypothetical protein
VSQTQYAAIAEEPTTRATGKYAARFPVSAITPFAPIATDAARFHAPPRYAYQGVQVYFFQPLLTPATSRTPEGTPTDQWTPVRGRGADLQEAVGKLQHAFALVGQNEILLLAPSTLRRE